MRLVSNASDEGIDPVRLFPAKLTSYSDDIRLISEGMFPVKRFPERVSLVSTVIRPNEEGMLPSNDDKDVSIRLFRWRRAPREVGIVPEMDSSLRVMAVSTPLVQVRPVHEHMVVVGTLLELHDHVEGRDAEPFHAATTSHITWSTVRPAERDRDRQGQIERQTRYDVIS